MSYTNDKIDKLIRERDAVVAKYDTEIRKEIMIAKGEYRFSWNRFCLLIFLIATMVVMFELNKKIFPETSLFSWQHYVGSYGCNHSVISYPKGK